MYSLQVIFEVEANENDLRTIEKLVKKAVDVTLKKHLEFDNMQTEKELNVIIVDNNKIQEINRTYRNKDYITDVISFASIDSKDDFIHIVEEETEFLGDIFISIDKAKEQAKEYKHSFEREISFLVIHGVLHLLGYDHIESEDEKIMFSLQKALLQQLNVLSKEK